MQNKIPTKVNNRFTINISGNKYGRLTVIAFSGRNKRYNALWECKCDCGGKVIANGKLLKNGNIKSCGCLRKETSSTIHIKHGCSHDRTTGKKNKLYGIWCSMKERCSNTHSRAYKYYGGKGITVCGEWVSDFSLFQQWAINNGYSETLSIDRVNPYGNYCPENCRWATKQVQARNRTSTKKIIMNGEIKTVPEWSDLTGISSITINQRLRRGWTSERILTTKI